MRGSKSILRGVGDAVREQHLLEPLALLEGAFDPESTGIQHHDLGEVQDAFHVDLGEFLVVELGASQGDLFGELVVLPAVHALRDAPGIEVCFEELLPALLQLVDPAGESDAVGLRLGPLPAPRVEHDLSEQADVLGLGPKAGQKLHEPALERVLSDVDCSAAPAGASVVGVLPIPAPGPAPSERRVAGGATDEPAERKVGVVPRMGGDGDGPAVEHVLNAIEDLPGDDGLEIGRNPFDSPRWHSHDSRVDRVPQCFLERLHRKRLPGVRRQPVCGHVAKNLRLGPGSLGVQLESLAYQRRRDRVRFKGLPPGSVEAAAVAEGDREGPAPFLQGRGHTGDGTLGSHVVVELSDGREHVLHQPFGGGIADRLGRRSEGDAELLQVGANSDVDVTIAAEPIYSVNDEVLDGSLVLAAVLEGFDQSRALRRLGGLALFDEDLADLPPLLLAVLEASSTLGGQAHVLNLLLRRDAAVHDGADFIRAPRGLATTHRETALGFGGSRP